MEKPQGIREWKLGQFKKTLLQLRGIVEKDEEKKRRLVSSLSRCLATNLINGLRAAQCQVLSQIPGRWRRHCPHGPKMSRSGCNLIGDGLSNESENSANAGRCVCGPAVPWCPNEPHPYTFATRHECKLNLAAKIAYDDVLNAPDSILPYGDVEVASLLRNCASLREEAANFLACDTSGGGGSSSSGFGSVCHSMPLLLSPSCGRVRALIC
ncbi:hypothetical protein PV326_010577 [Microctonus aethiopoides]|nr:hypothetical protein PV326_010577 [Microctonus aethiopoides]